MREDHAALRAAGGILRARTHGGSSQSLGIACEGGASDLIDFSVNVNPAGPSPRAVAAACRALSRIDAYPDRESLALVRALSRAQGIPEDTIVCGAGASDIIWRLAAAVRPKRIVVCAPTFSEYAEAASYYGACVQEFPLSEADDFDVPDQVPPEVMAERSRRMRAAAQELAIADARRRVGTVERAVLEYGDNLTLGSFHHARLDDTCGLTAPCLLDVAIIGVDDSGLVHARREVHGSLEA